MAKNYFIAKKINMKQVIVIRTDLKNKHGHKLPKGKLVTQGAHVAVKCVLNCIGDEHWEDQLQEWLDDNYVKITLGINSESELEALYWKAKSEGLNVEQVVDIGLTEFDKPTLTAICIGPHDDYYFDGLTDNLKLFQ